MTHSVKSLADGLQTVEQALTGLPVRVGERAAKMVKGAQGRRLTYRTTDRA